MDAEQTAVSKVHFYDTHTRTIACGLRGFDHRSTKHPRQVTCGPCVERLGAQLRGHPGTIDIGEPRGAIS
jgi:hypothetical protein